MEKVGRVMVSQLLGDLTGWRTREGKDKGAGKGKGQKGKGKGKVEEKGTSDCFHARRCFFQVEGGARHDQGIVHSLCSH